MAFIEVNNVRIAGISACVPQRSVPTNDEAFAETTGIVEHRYDAKLTVSDLGFKAVDSLLMDLGWDKTSIGAIIVVTSTSDYILPSTACILQDKLGLPKDCLAMDITLACSGWVYGLCSLASIVSSGKGQIGRALLLAGEGKDRVEYDNMLFGSCCSATAVEFSESASTLKFHLGTDGSGYDALIIPDGGAKNGLSPDSFNPYEYDGRKYNRLQLRMNGIDVFSFAITTAPKSLKMLSEHFNLDLSGFDYYVFHQANKTINSTIVRKLKVDPAKAPSSIEHFGNTSSASIPLTIVTQLKGQIENAHKKFLCCGFGVGLSWGSIAFETDDLVISDLVEIGESE